MVTGYMIELRPGSSLELSLYDGNKLSSARAKDGDGYIFIDFEEAKKVANRLISEIRDREEWDSDTMIVILETSLKVVYSQKRGYSICDSLNE